MAYRRDLPLRTTLPAMTLAIVGVSLLRFLVDHFNLRRSSFESYIATALPAALVAGFTAIILRRRARYVPPGHCPQCRYDLTGNLSGKCPECGTPISERTKAS